MLYINHTLKDSAVMVVDFLSNGLSCCPWTILVRRRIPISLIAVRHKTVTLVIHTLSQFHSHFQVQEYLLIGTVLNWPRLS